MSPIRVLLVDDHPVVRLGIRKLLQVAPDIAVVGEAGDGYEALRLVDELSPDVILLDMELPGLSGSQVASYLQLVGSSVKILVLSGYADTHYIQELLANGASGYLTKDEVPETIIEAVRGVARGEQGWISRQVAEQMTSIMQSEREPYSQLTRREVEVLQSLVEGKSNKDIARDLHMSNKTVEKHVDAIFNKLKVTSRVEAAVLAVRQGWFKDTN